MYETLSRKIKGGEKENEQILNSPLSRGAQDLTGHVLSLSVCGKEPTIPPHIS